MNTNARNLKEFKELIERYETITLDEIEKAFTASLFHWQEMGWRVAQVLTGFGAPSTCSLCKAVNKGFIFDPVRCSACVWGGPWMCQYDKNKDTYDNIYFAATPQELLTAFRQRAAHMKTLLNKKV